MKLLAIALSSSVLVACGGGGGGSSVAPLPTAPTAVLNSSNQSVAAQDAASTAFMPMLGAQTLTGAQTTDESVLFSIAREQMAKLPVYMADAKAESALTGVVQSQTVACTSGGSLTVSVNDADNNGVLSAGDSLTISANTCVEAAGTLTGSLGFVINNLSGTLGSSNYSAGITLTFGSFSVSSSLFSGSINGSLSLAATANGVNSLSETISTPSLTVAGTYGGVTRSRSLTNYSATASRVPNASSYQTSYSINATLTSTGLSSQAISVATTTPFVRQRTDVYPSSGEMLLTDSSNAKLKITALSNTQVKEELDANGDGLYESNTTVNWTGLM